MQNCFCNPAKYWALSQQEDVKDYQRAHRENAALPVDFGISHISYHLIVLPLQYAV